MIEPLAQLARAAGATLPRQPALVTWVQVAELDGGQLQLRSPECFYNLRHPLLAEAFRAARPLLTGEYTVGEITQRAPASILPTTILFMLKVLCSMGLLIEAATPSSDLAVTDEVVAQRRFLSLFHDNPLAAERRLISARVALTGSERLVELVTALLGSMGCGISHAAPWALGDTEAGGALQAELATSRPDLLVVCGDGLDRSMAIGVNDLTVEQQLPWLHVSVLGRTALLGPLVIPGETACYACFETRLLANRLGPGEAPPVPELAPGALGSFRPFLEVVAGHIAGEVSRFLAGYAPPATVGAYYELDATSPAARQHQLLRAPSCRSCAPAPLRQGVE